MQYLLATSFLSCWFSVRNAWTISFTCTFTSVISFLAIPIQWSICRSYSFKETCTTTQPLLKFTHCYLPVIGMPQHLLVWSFGWWFSCEIMLEPTNPLSLFPIQHTSDKKIILTYQGSKILEVHTVGCKSSSQLSKQNWFGRETGLTMEGGGIGIFFPSKCWSNGEKEA